MSRPCLSIIYAISLLFALTITGCSDDDNRTGSQSCTEGTANCACFSNNTCNVGLTCIAGTCVDPNAPFDAGDNDATVQPPDELALIFRTPSDIMDFGPKEVRDVRESKDWQASAIQ